VTAQRQNSTTRSPDVAEEKLEDRSGTNNLNAFGLLGPTDGVTNRCGLVGSRGGNECVRHFLKQLGRNATNLLHHFGGVARKMAAQHLENAARMLQRRIALGETQAVALVEPALRIVGALLFVPARKKTGRPFLGVAKIFAQNAGGISEVHHIIAKEKVVLDNVPDECAQKRDVAAGTDRHPNVGQGTGAGKSWIDMDNGRAALFCLHHPAETNRVRLGHGRAFD